ncbi:DUF4276 family protein [Actinocorallia sp. API 0066]|uniref:DUF4276 family protein n=1 Tax=Actinocorallia sp. API 0066 TaxID=2896846 RepID=UPI001E630725|nr:DUF4276 family protein [Actinocorallia sp. API 0066]MCD0448291.1 DUF4276 family protein [Actinocorallia sp. API 0066]
MSRPLRPGLVTEGESDQDFLLPVIDRYLAAELVRNRAADFDLLETVPSPRVKKHGKELFTEAARALGRRCHLVFVHADFSEAHEADALLPVLACAAVVLVPKRETESWMLADPAAFQRLRGARTDLLPRDPAAVEREPKPKALLARVVKPARVSDPADYFGLLGEDISLQVLGRVPAFARWADDTKEALKGLGYL